MSKAEVQLRQKELKEDLRQYLEDRKTPIEAVWRRVVKEGAVRAAGGEELLANARHATVAESTFLEQTHNSDDKAPINFLELGMRAARAVCHVVDENRVSLGSGFLVAPGLMVTNNHVLADRDAAEAAAAVFSFELDADENPLRPARFRLTPERGFVTSPKKHLDFSFVAVSPVGESGEELSAQGWLPMDERPNKILDGQPVVIIQHPDGQMKAICLFDSVCRFRDDDPVTPYLLYTTDTDFGSSGSPAFNRFWQVIALHHASVTTDEMEKGKPVVMNRGIRISSIFKALKDGPGERVQGTEAHTTAIRQLLADPGTRRKGRPFAVAGAAPRPPEEVVPEANRRPRRSSGTVIRRKEADHFADREGYNPMFLTDAPDGPKKPKHKLYVGLPVLPDWLAEDAAPLKGRTKDYELRYQHFSIVMSKSRNLAIFTACNVDGSQMYRLDRKDRDPDDPLQPDVAPEAASDVWFYDPRLDERYQLGPEIYDETSFDYGHLVRRLDPVWGSDDRIPRIANDDTFCMTNCSPQEVRFHRTRKDRDGNWSALEDVILNEANLKDKRFTVVTGPVLDARDRTILGVKVPDAFWKIAAYEDEGRLKAHGFLLWQDEEVEDLDARFEGRIDLSRARKPVPIREIARLTGLDFGALFEADVRGRG